MAYIGPANSVVAFQGTVPFSVLGVTTGSVISINQGSIAAVIVGGSIAGVPNQSISGTVDLGNVPLLQVSGSVQAINGTSSSPSDGLSNTSAVANTLDSAGGSRPGIRTFPNVFNGTNWDRLRGNSSVGALVSTANTSVISINQGSIATVIIGGSIAASFTPPANQSVSGTVQVQVQSSVGVVIIGGSILTSSTPNQSVSGTVGASIIGLTPVAVTNTPTVNIGTIPGSVVAFQGGTWSQSVVGQGAATALTNGWPMINGEANDSTGTFTNGTQTTSVTNNNLDGYGNSLVSINGTYGTATAIFEGSDDGGTTWFTVNAARDDLNVIETGYTSLTNTSRSWQINNSGFDSIRVRSTAVASGTVNVRISSSSAPNSSGATVGIGTALPAGGNMIGSIAAYQGTVPWAIAGSIAAFQAGTIISSISGGQASVFQGGAWTTSIVAANPLPIAGSVAAFIVGSSSVITVFQAPSIVGTYAEDAPSASGDKGFLVMGARNDTLASVTSNDGDYSSHVVGPAGELIAANAPFTKWVQGTTSVLNQFGTSMATIAAQGSSIFTYVTGVQVANMSASSVLITFSGATSSVIGYTIAPAGGGSNIVIPNAWKTSANGAFTASVSGASSVYISAEGFISKT